MQHISYETLYQLYVEELMTQQEIAQHWGCSLRKVRQSISRYQIPTNRFFRRLKMSEEEFEKRLTNLMVEKGRSVDELAEELQVFMSTVRRYLTYFGLNTSQRKQHAAFRGELQALYEGSTL